MRPLVNSAAIRKLNVIRVFHALRGNPLASQRDLCVLTGLDKATVSAVVAQLFEDGLVERRDAARARRVGRPETALAVSPAAGVLVGARLEPGTIRLVTATLDGVIREHLQVPGSRDVDVALRCLRDGIERLVDASHNKVLAIGVGIPGLIDREGSLTLAPNLGWRDAPILSLLQAALDAPVFVDNDTKAAAVAERMFGDARTVEDFVFLTGHSGVGGGLFLGGRLYRGETGYAGEIGHITVVPGGRLCGCGKHGCLETYVSETAILAQAAERGRELPDLGALAEAAAGGDPVVRELFDEAGAHLGLAVAHVVNLMNPSLVVLGGAFALVATAVLPALQRTLAEHALPAPLARVRLLVSRFGADAVPVGGVALAMDGFLAMDARATIQVRAADA